MVDFNNETTISTPAGEIIKVAILERRSYFIDALEAYHKQKLGGVEAHTNILKSRLLSLFLEVQPALERSKSKEHIASLIDRMKSKEYVDIYDAFLIINRWLDKTHLIKIDNTKVYDRRRAEKENENYGL